MFEQLVDIHARPKAFEHYTTDYLWTDDHTSAQMLKYHLDEDIDVSSRNDAFIDRSVAWILSHFAVRRGTRIADFGCGPGLYTTRLARHGADVTGIDFSPRSIQYARDAAAREGLEIHYVEENYLDFNTSARFELIIMIMCDFSALSPSQRRTMLEKFRNLLEPGGSVLLDVYSLAAFARREESATCQADLMDGFWSRNEYFGFLNVFKYPDENVVLDKYTIVERNQTRTVYNWLQYFDVNELKREFTECGLVVDETYADVAGSTYDPDGSEFAVVANKACDGGEIKRGRSN
ncbi:MAG TPA: class I SAM-dependent methyltransferase [Thermoguttaceae bacterium]|nr:class I SAM-dependent methyltransferase [Thermoguttaceae bacterium]